MGWKDSDASQGWYLHNETAKAAQEMYNKHSVLFETSRKLKPESIKYEKDFCNAENVTKLEKILHK
jgi:hypothetical protein